MGFFKSIAKVVRNVGRAVRKVAAPIGAIAGAAIGGPVGSKLGGSIGGMITGMFEKSTVPEISTPVNDGYTPVMYGTPGFIGGRWGGLNPLEQTGATVYRDGTATTADGRIITDKNLVSEIYGSPNNPHYDDSNNSAAPLLFGFGALLLLSD